MQIAQRVILRGIATIALFWAGGGMALAQQPNSGQVPFTNWMTTLQSNGYTVTQGTEANFQGCNDFIPGGPVITSDLWQVAPDQAIVTIITLPPQGAYFGFQTYMLERSAAFYTGSAGTPPGPTPCSGLTGQGEYTEAPDGNLVIFNNFYNTVNNADIAANIPAFNGSAWNTYNDSTNPPQPTSYNTIAIITTPNKSLAQDMVNEFSGDHTMVFTEKMPATTTPSEPAAPLVLYPCTNPVYTPPSSQCDVFASIIRFTLAETQPEANAWLAGGNILVYRVELPTVGTAPSNLYDAQTDVYDSLFQQGCNTSETTTVNLPQGCVPATLASSSFDHDLQAIATALAQWGQQATITPDNPNGDTYQYFEASGTGQTSNNNGIATCIETGKDCSGPTQDTDFYRGFNAGTLNNLDPVFVVGVLHSDSPDDFSPNGTTVLTAPVNNADYTGISIADISSQYSNWGVADAANPNSASEYYVPPRNRVMLGSAYAVLSYLRDNPINTGPTLFSQLPISVQQDINNIYIHVFQRNDDTDSPTCAMQTCSNALDNDVTTIVSPQPGDPPASTPPSIPDADTVRLTERGYLLAPTPGASYAKQNFTGAAVQYLQSLYIVCDTTTTSCGSSNQN